MEYIVNKIDNADELVKCYTGKNPFIKGIKLKMTQPQSRYKLSSFEKDYITKFSTTEPIKICKNYEVADWYAAKLKSEWEIDFLPKKIFIGYLLAELDGSYHCYVKYYTEQEKPLSIFIPKRALFGVLNAPDWKSTEIDFTCYEEIFEKMGKKMFQHQKDGVKFFTTVKKGLLADEQGLGKFQPNTTLIPSPNGFVKMGDLVVGDRIFGSDGNICTVLKVFPQGIQDVYKVIFNDGVETYCGLDHLWITRSASNRKRDGGQWKVKTLGEILKWGLHKKKTKWNIENNHNFVPKWEIPMCMPISYSKKDFLVDPYLLGVVIGDGSMCGRGIHISIPNSEVETVGRLSGLLHSDYRLSCNKSPACPCYSIVRKNIVGKNINIYNREIKRLGLNVKGGNKFIPKEYFYGSVEQRIDLLQGLMDSDGYVDKTGAKLSFSSTSIQLCKDLKNLVYSLGGKAKIHLYKRKDKKNDCYLVQIQIKLCPFKLERKKNRYKISKANYCSRFISDVAYHGKDECTCILVSSPDHSYVTNDYIVTHNTSQSIISAEVSKTKKVLVICPASSKTDWKKEIGYFTSADENVDIIDGSEWKSGKKYTIINYDILENFCKPPLSEKIEYYIDEETGAKLSKVATKKVRNTKTQKVEEKKVLVKSRKKDEVLSAISDSQLIQERYDVIIVDEVHKYLSNVGSNVDRVFDFFIKNSVAEYVWLLSGTPLTNNVKNLYNVLKRIDADITKDYLYYMERYAGQRKLTRKDNGRSFYVYAKEPLHTDELAKRIENIYLRRLKKDIPGLPSKTIIEKYYDLPKEDWGEYNTLWDEYEKKKVDEYVKRVLKGELSDEDMIKLNKDLTEGTLIKKFLANKMVPKTIKLCDEHLSKGEKVFIICSYDDEIDKFKEYYGDVAVVFNGKMTSKQKDAAKEAYMTDPNIKVFIGNIIASGVGLTLTAGNIAIFNSFSYRPDENEQVMDRIHRLSQLLDVFVYFQLFKNTALMDIWNIVVRKQTISGALIKSEAEKK